MLTMVNFIAISLYGNKIRGGYLDIILIVLLLAVLAAFGVYIYLYYKKEKKRQYGYKLYTIKYVQGEDTYVQIIGAKSEEEVETIFYNANEFTEDDVEILSIEQLSPSDLGYY